MRVVARGYRVSEVGLKHEDQASDAKITVVTDSDQTERPVVMVSAGCHVDGQAPPHVDPTDTDTVEAGLKKRMARKLPVADRQLIRGLKRFVTKYVKRNLVPLAPDIDTSVESWLDKTSYTLERKKELLNKYSVVEDKFDRKYRRVKSFVKDETYLEYKHCRWINSRTDEFKTFVGPIFQLISDVVFAMPQYIKKIPVSERPKYILDLFGSDDGEIVATDYTSYEASFVAALMDALETPLYTHMVQLLPEAKEFMRHVNSLKDKNLCESKLVKCQIPARRMSGEMNTSLGNGWANHMIFLYVCKLSGIPVSEVRLVVEGDDGLAKLPRKLDESLFERLGLTVKLERHTNVSMASFCGIVFSPDALATLTDPLDVVVNFGWLNSQYKDAKQSTLESIIRCKALSLLYQYRGCPVIQDLCIWVLNHTMESNIERRHKMRLNLWERDQMEAAVKWWKSGPVQTLEIHEDSRRVVESKYGLAVSSQIRMEEWFKNHDYGPISVSIMPTNKTWENYWDRFCGYDFTDRHPSKFY
jgi:hypothetical protein